ncbi:DNA recombination protein RmuC [Xylanibacter ruminicola]|uniref:DNA recombination protein RmuC n=1 Tax=Xylanibacter ruminicola TaxID=839 RepID=A0A1M7JTE9_XYLRU|nr:DNA recombination protein RmuC [Xylanibacter ruminicola]SHM56380.1 DNA recombination protein RmuC [Xylanibacter ruminicola]
MELMIIAIVSVVFGVLVGVWAMQNRQKMLQNQVENLQSQMQHVKDEAQEKLETVLAEKDKACENMIEAKDKACNNLIDAQEKRHQESIAAQETRHQQTLEAQEKRHKEAIAAQEKRQQEALSAQQSRFNETMQKVTAQVKSATEDLLKKRQEEFAAASNENIGQIVNPLKESLDKMKRAMDESILKQTEMGGEMKSQISIMMRQSEAAKKSADELANVLKHRSKVQGDWGETVLDELLESQGLTRGVHYDVQPYLRDKNGDIIVSDEGSKMRPDVILHLDKQREVIIDSKVSLTAFMDYANAENEEDRDRFLKAHVDSINKHVKELSTKDYSSYIKAPKVKMDYVIMFVPHTGALWTALNAQPDLWRKAMDKNVFIADEQSLFAALRIINLTWTQIAQAQNQEEVFRLANEILDRVGQFMKKYQAIGKALSNATEAYNDGEKKLQPSGQSILQSCGKLIKVGAKQSQRNPLPQLADDGTDVLCA